MWWYGLSVPEVGKQQQLDAEHLLVTLPSLLCVCRARETYLKIKATNIQGTIPEVVITPSHGHALTWMSMTRPYTHTQPPAPVDSTYFIRHYGTFWRGGHHFCCFDSVYHVLTHYSSLLQDLFFVTKEVSVGWRKKEPSKTELSGTGAWRMLEHGQTQTSSERTGISRESPQGRWDQRGISGFWVEEAGSWPARVIGESVDRVGVCRVFLQSTETLRNKPSASFFPKTSQQQRFNRKY